MANSVDPDKTSPIGAVCSGSRLFASLLNLSVSNARQLFAADNFSRRHFQMHFFLGSLRVKTTFSPIILNIMWNFDKCRLRKACTTSFKLRNSK